MRIARDVTLLRHPYPYRAMLAVSSDCDGMTLAVFEDIHRFLNTDTETPYGPGLGLDISDSMWVFARPPAEGTALSDRVLSAKAGLAVDAPEDMAPILSHYVDAGWIDTLHSIGDFSLPRAFGGEIATGAHVDAAVDTLGRHGIRLPVWVNHGNANNIQNIGPAKTVQGANPDSPVYMLDALRDFGTRYLNAIPGGSSITLPPLDVFGTPPVAWSFSRFYTLPHDEVGEDPGLQKLVTRPDGSQIGYIWHPSSLHLQLSPRILDELVGAEGFGVFAQHLGYLKGSKQYPPSALSAFRTLREYQDRYEILVVRTSRLLNYMRVWQSARIRTERTRGRLIIDISALADPTSPEDRPDVEAVRGFSFHVVRPPPEIILSVDGRAFDPGLCFFEALAEGSAVTGIRWHDPKVSDHTLAVRSDRALVR